MFSRIEMDDFTTIIVEYNKNRQYAKGNSRNSLEINRNGTCHVVLQVGSACLRGRAGFSAVRLAIKLNLERIVLISFILHFS